MIMKIKLLIGIIILLIIARGYPDFFILEPYGGSGGFISLPQDRICSCIGIPYSYDKVGAADAGTLYYCLGFVHDCKCYDKEKVKDYGEAFDKGMFEGSYQDHFEENAYSECKFNNSEIGLDIYGI